MKELFKNTLIYSIARIVPGITGFILLPIYTNYLDPSEYGKVQSMQVLGMFLIILFSLATERSIFRLYYDYTSLLKKKQFLGNIFFLILVSATFCCSFIFVWQDYFSLIFKSIEFYPYYFYIIIYAFFTSFSFIPLNLFQVKGKALRFTVYSISGFLLTTSLILYFLLYNEEGASGILKGQLVASGIMLIFYLIEIFKNSIFKINKKIIKNILSFSIPFIPVLLSSWLINMSSRVFLDIYIENSKIALSEIGIYSFAFKIASIGAIIIASVYTAYNPIFYKEANSTEQIKAKKNLKKIKFFYAFFALLVSFSIALVSKELVMLFFSKDYYPAIFIIPLISLCFFFNQINGLYNLMLYQEKKTNKVMYNLIISSLQALGATAISAFSVLSVLGTLFVCHTLGKLNGHLAFLTLRPSKARLAACSLAVSLPACPCR